MEEEEQRSSFWSTVPGILTGVAAVISAATGGYLAFIRMPNAAASDSPHIAAAAELKPAAIAATPKEPSNSEISRGTCHAKLFVQYASTRRGRCSARPTADFPEPSCDRRCRCHGNSVRGSAANHFFGPAKALFRLCPSLDAR